jgi:amino acid permease
MAASHVLTYNEDDDDDSHFGGGENVLMPVVSKEDYNKSSLISALFNLTTTMVGGGTLSLPYAIASSGYVLGPIIIVLVAIFAAVSAHLLVRLSAKCSAPSYKDIAIDAFGVIGAKV